ncbi:MAG: T9SS type A sorting domain-containing protein, partial [Saprospiraceae bacterium]
SSLFVIPYYVLGPTNPEVAILGTTVQPQLPYLVLHAPPGDGSSSEFQDSKTTCREFTETYQQDNSNSANLAVKLGIAGSLGFIATVNFEFSVTFSGGVTAGDLSIMTNSNQTCVTVNQGFSTTELSGPDGGGDVFIGYGTDLAYGVYEKWTHDPGACQIRLDTGLIYTPIGLPRRFAYTKSAILSDMALLQSVVADSLTVSAKTANDAQNQIDVWNQVLALNDANVNNPNNVALTPVSFSSGVNSSQESSITVTETNSIQVEHYLEGTFGVEAVVEVGGSGVTGGYEYKSSQRFGKTQNQSAESSKLVRYTLADDDSGDVFNLDVFRDPMFGTPIFKIKNGTKSSCPYQGGYQRDQPRLKHDGQASDHITLAGNLVGSSATFKLDLCNESNEARTYKLKLNAQSNLNGAVVLAAGVPLNGNETGQTFTVPANGCIQDLVVEVKMQSPTSPLSYPDLELYLYPACEEEVQSSVFASVYFGNASATEEASGNISQLTVFPNPASGMVNVSFELQEPAPVRFEIRDLTGRLQSIRTAENRPAGKQQEALDVAQLPAGIYLLDIQAGASRLTRKLVIER